jgi:hypothetical protein
VAKVEHIAGYMSHNFKLTFDDIRVDGMMEMAYDHSVGSIFSWLISIALDIVSLELINQPTIGITGRDIDFDHLFR